MFFPPHCWKRKRKQILSLVLHYTSKFKLYMFKLRRSVVALKGFTCTSTITWTFLHVNSYQILKNSLPDNSTSQRTLATAFFCFGLNSAKRKESIINLKTFATNSHPILSHETNYGTTTGKMKKVKNSTTHMFFFRWQFPW